jgi:hypothetical protein
MRSVALLRAANHSRSLVACCFSVLLYWSRLCSPAGLPFASTCAQRDTKLFSGDVSRFLDPLFISTPLGTGC